MKTKLTPLFLFLIVASLVFLACGNNNSSDQDTSGQATEDSQSDFEMKIESAFCLEDGCVGTGRIKSGTIEVGDIVIIKKSSGDEIESEVISIEMVFDELESATKGDQVGIVFEKDVQEEDLNDATLFLKNE